MKGKLLQVISAFILLLSSTLHTVAADSLAVHFSTASFALDDHNAQKLKEFLTSVDFDDTFALVIKGYADHRGSAEYNHALAMRRAESVREAMMNVGLEEFDIRLESAGEAQSNQLITEDAALLTDRRVDVILRHYNIATIEDLHRALGMGNVTAMTFDPGQKQVLRTIQGTEVTIPEDAFLDDEGNVIEGQVTLKLTEALSNIEFVTEGLATVSDGQILESGGMFRLDATDADGNPVQLADGTEISTFLPASNPDPRMQLFVSQDGANWEPTQETARMQEPEYGNPPYLYYTEVREPKFQDTREKEPRKPAVPIEPKSPEEPDWSKYDVEFKWWEFFGKKKKLLRAESMSNNARERYDAKVAKYNRKMEKYVEDTGTYDQRLEAYEKAHKEWEIEGERQLEEFENTVMPAYRDKCARQRKIDVEKHEKRFAVWKARRDSLYNDYMDRASAAGQLDDKILGGYTVKMSQLGWANCDYFWQDDGPKETVVFQNDEPGYNPILVTFDDARVMMRPDLVSREEGQFKLSNVPRNQKATVIAYRVDEGKIMVCQKPLSTRYANRLEYEQVTLREFKKMINQTMGQEV